MYIVTRTYRYNIDYLRVKNNGHIWTSKRWATKISSEWAAWNWVQRLSRDDPNSEYSVAEA